MKWKLMAIELETRWLGINNRTLDDAVKSSSGQ